MKKLVLIEFKDDSSQQSALQLYCNLNFLPHSPPTFIVPIAWIKITNESTLNCENQSFLSLKSLLASNSRNRNNEVDHLKDSSILKTYLLYPTCTFCLRRVRNINTIVGTNANDLLISKSIRFNDWQHSSNSGDASTVHCLVCYLHSRYDSIDDHKSNHSSTIIHFNKESNEKSIKYHASLGRCMDCDIADNIWMCMICCYTGCGRYSSKHAEQHYHNSGQQHHLSLELTSGCIWDYARDCFAHIEDPAALTHRGIRPFSASSSSSYSRNNAYPLNHYHPSSSQQLDGRLGDGSVQGASESKTDSSLFSSTEGPTVMKPTSLCTGMNPPQMYLGFANAAQGPLDSVSLNKMDHLMGEYDLLLRSQLLDQQLYFEKLLAKETVKALELSFQQQQISRGTAKHAVSPLDMVARSSENDVDIDDRSLQMDLQEIERIKMDISAIEVEYKQVLESVREVDVDVRRMKKTNDAAISSIKQHKLREAEFTEKEQEIRRDCSEQVVELENQIKDLAFYSSTKSKLEFSPMKEEILGGVLMTTQSVVKNSTTSNNNSNNNGKKSTKGIRK
mmetsp:Transcript_19829/g.28348  ORF Transcript_19829/g.28348 Transcript_19829/m.28348 type:complete len:562 (+) Transcript_19829:136-1821(+)